MAAPRTKDELTKYIALNLQIALTAWHELYPEDSDADACSKSLDLVEFDLEDMLTRPDAPVSVEPETQPEAVLPSAETTDDDEIDQLIRQLEADTPTDEAFPDGLRPKRSPQQGLSFRQMLIEIARQYPRGFDITQAVDDAHAQGFTHPTPRNLVSVTASGLVRAGILVRRGRGTFALSPAFLGKHDEDDEEEEEELTDDDE